MDLSAIFDWVIGLIQELISFILSILSELVQLLNAVFGAIWQVLVNLVSALVSLFQKIATFFVNLWTNYIKPAIQGLIDLYKRIRDWLQQVLGPIIRIITQIRAWFYKYIYPWIKLTEEIISIVRAFLSALRLLGVQWAAKLDAELAQIQGFITGVLQGIVSTLNQATTWLNLITDPSGLFRSQVFSGTMFANLSSVYRSVNFGKNRYLSASEAANTQGDLSMAGGGSAVLTRNQDGSVTYSDASKRVNQGFTDGWNSYGNPRI